MVARKYLENVRWVYRMPVTDIIVYLSIVIGKQVYAFVAAYAPSRASARLKRIISMTSCYAL